MTIDERMKEINERQKSALKTTGHTFESYREARESLIVVDVPWLLKLLRETREALMRYGKHDDLCLMGVDIELERHEKRDCDCGYDKALRGES